MIELIMILRVGCSCRLSWATISAPCTQLVLHLNSQLAERLTLLAWPVASCLSSYPYGPFFSSKLVSTSLCNVGSIARVWEAKLQVIYHFCCVLLVRAEV